MNILFYFPNKSKLDNASLSFEGHETFFSSGNIFVLSKNFSQYKNIDIIFFIDLEQNDKNLNEISLLLDQNPNFQTVLVLQSPNPDFLIKAMRVGISEIITNYNKKVFVDTINRIEDNLTNASNTKKNKNLNQTFALMSAKGGDGSTLVTASLAAELAQNPNYKILLMDIALPFGDLQFFVSNEKMQFDITDLISAIDRLDEPLIKSMVHEINENYHLIAAPDKFEKAITINADNLNNLIKMLKNLYDVILIDCGSSLNPIISEILQIVDHIYIINQVDLLSIKKAIHILQYCHDLDIPEKNISMILNQVHEKNIISVKDVEKAISKKVAHALPYEKRFENFLIDSKNITSKKYKSEFADIFKKWTSTLTATDDIKNNAKKEKKSIWKRLRNS